MSRFLFGGALLGAFALTVGLTGEAKAQFGPGPFAGGFPTAQAGAPQASVTTAQQGGVLSLPPSVKKVVSIDAHNMLLAQVEDKNGETSIVQMKVDHNYSGGMARLFGGDVVPTGPFVSPGFANGQANTNLGGLNITGAGMGNGFNGNLNGGLLNGGGFNGFNGGFLPNNLGSGTTVTGSGIFAPPTQMPRAQMQIRK